jgi:bacterioferritin-associated ferredoxin
MNERHICTCHDIDIEKFRAACKSGARNVKTCFIAIGCLPKCSNCIPMVRSVLAEFAEPTQPEHSPAGKPPANISPSS